MDITAYWISDKWELKSLLIDFIKLEGLHTGINIKEAFLKSLIADPSLNDTKSICRSVADPYMNDDNWQILTPILSYKITLICNNNSPINYIERE